MNQDPELRDRLGRAVDELGFDEEHALGMFHASRRRRVAARRVAVATTALLIAVAGVTFAWWALPIGSDRVGTGTEPPPSGPAGTIAYMRVTEAGATETASIFATDVTEPDPLAIGTDAFSAYPVWSPDGSRVAYESGADYDHRELMVANADGTEARSLGVPVDGTLAWSPSGDEIAYTRGDGGPDGYQAVAIIGVDGSNDRVASRWSAIQSVSWSPDGTRLVVTGHPPSKDGVGGPEDFDIYSSTTDGSDLVQLTHTLEYEHFAAWSPDGSSILFARSPDYDDADYPSDVWVMNADGSDQRQLTDWRGFDSFPVWSPDGSWIAFASDRDASAAEQAAFRQGDGFSGVSLFTIRVDGSGVQRLLTAAEGEVLLPSSWKADGA
jgi:Tol biopolymer transport system component